MDGVLRVRTHSSNSLCTSVSILVLMDGVLRGSTPTLNEAYEYSFNPCSNGWCTSSFFHENLHSGWFSVSILVLMDGVLRDAGKPDAGKPPLRFNPCSNGWCTSSLTHSHPVFPAFLFQSLF